MRIEAVLLDIDGTLVDSNEQHVKAWEAAFAEAGQAQSAATIREQIGKGGDLLVPALLPSLDKDAAKAISEGHDTVFNDRYLDGIRPFPQAADLVRALHGSGRKVVLASSASGAELDHYAGLLGIADCLMAKTSSDEVNASKPAPDIFGAALVKAGVAADHAMVVGDMPYDIEAAGKAGIAAIGLTSGPFDAARLRDAGAVAVYAGVAELLAGLDASPLA